MGDKIYCKKSKKYYCRQSDWNIKLGTVEFRPLMFENIVAINPNICYTDGKFEDCELNIFNIKPFKKLIYLNYHDIEILKIIRFGIRSPRCYDKSGKYFRDAETKYKHEKNDVSSYFDDKLIGPFSRQEIILKFSYPIVCGTIMSIEKSDNKFRFVIDKQNKNLLYEHLTRFPYKLRLPGLREVALYIQLESITGVSVIDYSQYYRQLPMNRYNSGNCIIKRVIESKEMFYIDSKAQMGGKFIPSAAQRVSSAVSFLFNSNAKHRNISISMTYQDDTVIFSKKDGERHAHNFIKLSQECGLDLKLSKCVINQQRAVWLGITFDFKNKTISPSPKRIKSLLNTISKLHEKRACTLQEIQSFLGKLASLTISGYYNIKPMLYSLRGLDNEKYASSIIKISDSHIIELKLARNAIMNYENSSSITFNTLRFIVESEYKEYQCLNNEEPIELVSELILLSNNILPSENYILSVTDASMSRSGGLIIFKNRCQTFSFDNLKFTSLSIDKKECIAAVVSALICVEQKIKADGIIMLCDSEITRYIIVKSNAKSLILKKLTCILGFEMSKGKYWYSCVRISTKVNLLADKLSRIGYLDSGNLDYPVRKVSDDLVLEIISKIDVLINELSYFKFLEQLIA